MITIATASNMPKIHNIIVSVLVLATFGAWVLSVTFGFDSVVELFACSVVELFACSVVDDVRGFGSCVVDGTCVVGSCSMYVMNGRVQFFNPLLTLPVTKRKNLCPTEIVKIYYQCPLSSSCNLDFHTVVQKIFTCFARRNFIEDKVEGVTAMVVRFYQTFFFLRQVNLCIVTGLSKISTVLQNFLQYCKHLSCCQCQYLH